MKPERAYILYDGRACGGVGTDDASIFVYCDTVAEAESYKGDFGDMACYSYEIRRGQLRDEKWEWDYLE